MRLPRLQALSLALLGLAGCAAVTPSPVQPSLLDEILANERRGLDALRVGDLATFGGSTADDAVFIDAHGVANKADVMRNVAQFRLSDYTIEDVQLVPLSPDSGLIAYTLTEQGTSHGRQFRAKAYISALWARRAGTWYCLFSQETGAK